MTGFRRIVDYLLDPRSRLGSSLTTAGKSEFGGDFERPEVTSRIRLRHIFLNVPLIIGALITLALFFIILAAPFLTDHDPFITAQSIVPHYDMEKREMVSPPFGPTSEYLLGTDQWGNDMLSLLMYGARVTLVVASYIAVLRLVGGTILGALAGWNADKLVDRIVMGVIAAVGSVPLLLSSMILVLALDIRRGVIVFIIALSLLGWTEIARMVRGETMLIRKMLYVEAAEATGLTSTQIVVRHALPNLVHQLLVIFFLELGAALLLLAELAFLGVYIGGRSRFSFDPVFGGAPVPLIEFPEWGGLVAQAGPYIRSSPHLIIAPALAFFVAIAGLNSLGEGLRRLLSESSVATGFLLRKRMFLVLVGVAAISAYVIYVTGPRRSYAYVAESYLGNTALNHANFLANLSSAQEVSPGDNPAAAYIAEQFRDLELQRGFRSSFSSSYYYEETENPTVIGFLPGYDFDLSDELVVVFARYDNGSSPAGSGGSSSVGVMLELVRSWNEKKVNPRRSLLFVAWGGEPFSREKAQMFLADEETYNGLPIATRQVASPVAVIQMDFLGEGGGDLWISPDSDQKLLRLFGASAGEAGLSTSTRSMAYDESLARIISDEIPSIAFQWSEPDEQVQNGAIESEKLAAAGETLSRALLKMVRQAQY